MTRTARSEETLVLRTAEPGSEHRFRSRPLAVTRRTLANLVGLAALFACAPLPLIGEAMAQDATGGLAIEPVSLPDMALGPRNAAGNDCRLLVDDLFALRGVHDKRLSDAEVEIHR